jgi:DMSO reductase anchor subunit
MRVMNALNRVLISIFSNEASRNSLHEQVRGFTIWTEYNASYSMFVPLGQGGYVSPT